MCNTRRKITLGTLLCLLCVPVCIAQTDKVLSGRELLQALRDKDTKDRRPPDGNRKADTRAITKYPNPTALLDKYAETQDKQKSYISKIELEDDIVESYRFREFKQFSGKKKRYEIEEVRFDGEERVNYHRTLWGDLSPQTGFTPKTEASHISNLWDGIDNLVSYSRSHDKPGIAFFSDPKKMHLEYGKTMSRGCNNFLTGFVSTGVYERIDSVLRQAGTVSMQAKTEQVNGVDCYVIDSDTKYGRYSVWIDPEHGYNIAKLTHIREGDDLWVQGHTMGKDHKISIAFEVLRFEKIDGVWVPMEVKTKHRRDFPPVRGIGGNWSANNAHVKRIEMVLNPDHDALGSFVLDDIRDGATVRMYSTPGIEYTWQDGKLVDERGRKVDLKAPKSQEPVSLVGRRMPVLEQFVAKLDPAEVQGKRILVCFWDMNQRPSRNCALRIKKKAGALSSKGVYVILAHAEPVDEDKLKQWLRKHDVALPVCRVTGDAKQVKQEWNVQSLPWLILTDKKHVVQSEGFGIEELDEKVKGLTDK